MKKLLLLIPFIFLSCELQINTTQKEIADPVNRIAFRSYFSGYMKGRLVYARANSKTKYQWAVDARDSYMITVGHLTAEQANEVLAEITNRWSNN